MCGVGVIRENTSDGLAVVVANLNTSPIEHSARGIRNASPQKIVYLSKSKGFVGGAQGSAVFAGGDRARNHKIDFDSAVLKSVRKQRLYGVFADGVIRIRLCLSTS